MRFKNVILSSILMVCVLFVLSNAQADAATLTYRFWDIAQRPAMEQIIAEFNEIYPDINIEIEITPFGEYWRALEIAATGRNLPDVFWINGPNFQLYAANDMLVSLSDLVEKSGTDMSGYPDSLINLYSYDGVLYAMPKDFDTTGFWYNKEIFDTYGVAYPDDTWTWEDVREAAKVMTDPANNIWGFGAYLNSQSGFFNTIWQAGGYVISEDRKSSGFHDPKTVEGLRFWVDILHKDKTSPTLAQMTDTSAQALFEAGKIAMFQTGSWNTIRFAENEYTRDRVDVTVLPKGEKRGVTIHGLGNAIAVNTRYPEEAWKFVEFLGSARAHEIQAQTGTVIPAWGGYQDVWVKAHPNFNAQSFIDQLDYSVAYPVSLYTERWTQLLTDELTPAWAGEISIDEAAANLARKMDAVLATE